MRDTCIDIRNRVIIRIVSASYRRTILVAQTGIFHRCLIGTCKTRPIGRCMPIVTESVRTAIKCRESSVTGKIIFPFTVPITFFFQINIFESSRIRITFYGNHYLIRIRSSPCIGYRQRTCSCIFSIECIRDLRRNHFLHSIFPHIGIRCHTGRNRSSQRHAVFFLNRPVGYINQQVKRFATKVIQISISRRSHFDLRYQTFVLQIAEYPFTIRCS